VQATFDNALKLIGVSNGKTVSVPQSPFPIPQSLFPNAHPPFHARRSTLTSAKIALLSRCCKLESRAVPRYPALRCTRPANMDLSIFRRPRTTDAVGAPGRPVRKTRIRCPRCEAEAKMCRHKESRRDFSCGFFILASPIPAQTETESAGSHSANNPACPRPRMRILALFAACLIAGVIYTRDPNDGPLCPRCECRSAMGLRMSSLRDLMGTPARRGDRRFSFGSDETPQAPGHAW